MKTLLIAILFLAALAGAAIYAGVYNVAADAPHWPITERLLEIARERSIEARAAGITPPPDLADDKRVLAGAGEYAEMCEACHLGPGVRDTELRQGLTPKPPELARGRPDPREAFWIVKHGIKMTGMPAWGATHDDDVLWSVVAFLQKLPELDERGYRDLVSKALPHDEAPPHRH